MRWKGESGVDLEALPWEAALEEEHEGVGKGLQVVSPAASAAQVGMHAGVPDSAPEIIWLLLILHMLSSRRPPFGGCRHTSKCQKCWCVSCFVCTGSAPGQVMLGGSQLEESKTLITIGDDGTRLW